MDNIQIWLYVAFGLIYLVVKVMRKNNNDEKAKPSSRQPESAPTRKPVSFEELLKEFSKEQEDNVSTEEEEQETTYTPRYQSLTSDENKDDHSRRRFADDESRKVYEESIKAAEGADIAFERNDHFRTSSRMRSRVPKEESQKSNVGSEILAALQDRDEAKKAVIMSEILNRRY